MLATEFAFTDVKILEDHNNVIMHCTEISEHLGSAAQDGQDWTQEHKSRLSHQWIGTSSTRGRTKQRLIPAHNMDKPSQV